jgi:TolB-like protein/DNA-binding winged helix-turn-helix (wHTH) protein/Tfp pilus assembly protein PilF
MISEPTKVQEPVRFGEDFALDLFARRLCRGSHRLKVERIPIEILALLVERPGEIVTRDEIAARVWGKGAFLDTDNSIRGAIRKIRQVLKDDPEQPRFIQTVTGQGYRFIAPLISSPVGENRANVSPAVEKKEQKPDRMHARDELESRIPLPPPRSFPASPFRAQILIAGVAIAGVAALAMGWYRYTHRTVPQASMRAIAVLPLENLSGDPSQEYFADGITDELITGIAQLRPLRVTSRTSIMRYKGTHKSLAEIGAELGVDVILEGTVMRSGGRVRITAQLVEARNDTHLWSAEYDREMKDVISVQQDVARDVAEQIRLNVLPQPWRPLAARVVDPEAYDAYLKGLHFWDVHTFESMNQALHYFEDSVSRDPRFAPAWAAMATSYCVLDYQGADRPSVLYPKALAAAQKALQLDPMSAEAHTGLACVHNLFEWNWEEGQNELRKAAELNPSYGLPHQWYSFILVRIGQTEQSIQQMKITLDLDPVSLRVNLSFGERLMEGRRYREAIRQYLRVVELYPDDISSHATLSYAYESVGNFEEAAKEFENFLTLDETGRAFLPTFKRLGYHDGKRKFIVAKAKQDLIDLNRKRVRGDYVPAVEFTQAYLQMGDKEKAMYFLEAAFEEHSSRMLDLGLPEYDALRPDPRFQKLIVRIGLPQAPAKVIQ